MCGCVSALVSHVSCRYIKPHHSSTYVHAAYCYRPSSVSVCLSVKVVNPVKTPEPIETPFGLRTRVGPGKHVLDGGTDPPCEGVILGKGGVQCKV